MGDNVAAVNLIDKRKRLFILDVFERLIKQKPLGTVGGVITLIFLLTGIFASVIAPAGVNDVTSEVLRPSSTAHLFGTDHLGRDVFSRVVYGARISMVVGLSAAALSIVVSLIIGIPSGYFGGKLDMIVQRFVDAWMFFPDIVRLMLLMSIVGYGMTPVILMIAVGMGIPGSRIIRGAVMTAKENMYIHAAQSIGCSTWRIFVRHVLPNIMAPIVTLFSIRVPNAILAEASLSFLGFGIPPPAPSWGSMLTGGERDNVLLAPMTIVWPGLALTIVVYGVNIFGDALRDLLDPSLRGGVGRFGIGDKIKKKEVIS
ncbi:MAG: ABC transporter permease [Spirochaetales bacterium]|nr:ABC transporter permease [Spirochaetales bacterium]